MAYLSTPERNNTIYQISDISSISSISITPPARTTSINKINKLNADIRTITATINAKVNNKSFRLEGVMSYQKEKKFRMIINSVMGREIDIGSNDSTFWFYSKRIKPPYLYYSRHENVANTRLKPLFNPLWLMESLSLDSLPISHKVIEKQQRLELINWEICPTGELVYRKILIDTAKPAIIGHYLFSDRGVLIASSEIEEFYTYRNVFIPKIIKFIWFEENECLAIELKNIKINSNLSSSLWQMPTMKNALDIGRYPH